MAYTIIKAVVAVMLYDDKSYFCQAVHVSSGAAIIIKKGESMIAKRIRIRISHHN
jgi:RNA polymerase subunit RPABC4/transcription elongation factor Spt4